MIILKFRRKKEKIKIINLQPEDIDNMDLILSILLDYNRYYDIIGISAYQLSLEKVVLDKERCQKAFYYFYELGLMDFKEYKYHLDGTGKPTKFYFIPNKALPRTEDSLYLKRTLNLSDVRFYIYSVVERHSTPKATNAVFWKELRQELLNTDRQSFLLVLDILVSEGFVKKIFTNPGLVYKLIRPTHEALSYDYDLVEYRRKLLNYILEDISYKYQLTGGE